MVIPQDKFLVLSNRVLTTTWYMFNSQFYQQTDGVATTISKELHPRKFWKRYVDEVHFILKRSHLETFFCHINNLNQNNNLTMEEESKVEVTFPDI